MASRNIRIRMYRVGFGDCFLVTLPGAEREHHILIDCGVHVRGDVRTMGDAVADIRRVTSDRLDLIIATHVHQDHLSGFGTYASEFREMTVGEVWLPWTEDPSDSEARRLKKLHFDAITHLTQYFREYEGEKYGAVQNVLLNLASNQTALTLLKSELKDAKVRYLEAGSKIKQPANIDDLTVEILGPPRDKAFLSRMDPPAAQQYLRLSSNGNEAVGIEPFAKKWRLKGRAKDPLDRKYKEELEEIATLNSEALAFSLDQAVNNTSIVAFFHFGGKHLLFAGDAQWGNWQYWIEAAGGKDLLSNVSFYKVAHHGSHNATPKSALEGMSKGKFAAMVSTQNQPWPSIPYDKLMDALNRQTEHHIVRSDSLHVDKAPPGPAIKKLPGGFSKGPFWYDYDISLRTE